MPDVPIQSQSFLDVLGRSHLDEEERLYGLCLAIENIVTSYDDQLDAFAETVQNAVDAVLQRWEESEDTTRDYVPRIAVHVDVPGRVLAVTDNGCAVSEEHFTDVFRPNFSLKRRLRQSQARGEKGAGVVFLQFGHPRFRFETKTSDWSGSYLLEDGARWFAETLSVLNREVAWEEKRNLLPADPHAISATVGASLSELDRGSHVEVTFSDNVRHPQLEVLFGEAENALLRLEYILRTRTAIGFYRPLDDTAVHPALKALHVTATVKLPDGSTIELDPTPTGFFFPHELAARRGSFASVFTAPGRNSELLYGYFDRAAMLANVSRITTNAQFDELIQRYEIQVYASYAYTNTYYEEQTGAYLQFELVEDDVSLQLQGTLIQVNGGFQIAVREYPNGRRHAFFHRSGAEDKSRTYLLFNFRGPYKPDYGRKNVADEVRPLVRELSKALILWASQKPRKDYLRTSTQQIPFSAEAIEQVRTYLSDEADRQEAQGPWINATVDPPVRGRPPKAEAEVIAEFSMLVALGALPGFTLYEVTGGMLDCLFDYHVDAATHVFDDANRPLGLMFPEGRDRDYRRQWIEFKRNSDQLTSDVDKPVGDTAKKWFTTINLLVCEKVDDATDNYAIEEVTSQNVAERRYYGVTHLLKSPANLEHVIQVIELRTLRGKLGLDATLLLPP